MTANEEQSQDVQPAPLRLFVALPVPEAVKAEMQFAQEELRRALRAGGASWTRPEQFHLTLKFLGDVDAARVGELTGALRAVCAGFGPMKLRAEGMGFFPDARIPRVLWAGIRDTANRLPELQQAVERATAGHASRRGEKKFCGHVTLGRIKNIRRSEAEALVKLAGQMAARVFGDWEAGAVELMRSELQPAGARHTCLASLRLCGTAGVK